MLKEDRETIRNNFLGEEDGNIFFFYQPSVAGSPGTGEVQSLQIVLQPFDTGHFRLLDFFGSRFPDRDDPFGYLSGAVRKVTSKDRIIRKELGDRRSQRAGMQVLEEPAARACGEGVYTLIRHRRGMHLVYAREIPAESDFPQEEIGLETEDDFILGVYNPEYEPEEEALRPEFRQELAGLFRERRMLSERLPEFLDVEGTRLALLRERSDLARELASKLYPEWEMPETAEIYRNLKLVRERYPVTPLFAGQ